MSVPAGVLELLREMIDTPSTTGDEAGIAAILERELERDGYRVTRQEVLPGRDNLLAVRDGETPRLFFSTHIDTVPPFLPYRREGDTIYGRGACDTKGGIVAMLEAGRRLRAKGASAFGFLFVVGEEVDHSGAKAAAKLPISTRDIVLCEPTVCRVIAAQKGVVKVRLDAEGRAAHSGFPHRGVSAVDRLLVTLETLRHLEWPRHDVLGETFFNVGLIAGGVAANVLAPAASAELMFRTVGPTSEILAAIDASLVDGVRRTVLTENGPELFDLPDGYETGVANFNTDASFLKSLGRILLVGPGDIEVAHSSNEHITVEQIALGIDLYERLGAELLDGGAVDVE
ncbi:MAG: M20/M25/M40 family metallo-hydrolase [Blastocatellia bacterium]|nr:M20/M25/M40 family metallo-hydrolase [Blastocatellia bacterium]